MAMEVIIKAAEESANPAKLDVGFYMPLLKPFMKDTTIICLNAEDYAPSLRAP